MRKRTIIGCLVFITAALVVASLLLREWNRPGLTLRNYSVIMPGMKANDVERRLGVAANSEPVLDGAYTIRTWGNENCEIVIYFDRTGSVVEKHGFGELQDRWLDRAFSWLGFCKLIDEPLGRLLRDEPGK